MSEPFIAEIRMFPYAFAPRGWAYCDGQLMSIGQNQSLFAIIGAIYGGDGRTTMAVPDLRGRTPMNWGAGPGLTSRNIGQSLGSSTETLSVTEMPGHTHSVTADAAQGAVATPANNFIAQGVKSGRGGVTVDTNNFNLDASSTVPMAQNSVASTGGGTPHNNRQLYLAVPFCIALLGIFPSRN